MYTLYVNSMSPYSIKASAMLGYAGLPCNVEHQNIVTRFSVLKRLTGKTMVPVLRRGEWAINDSSRIARFAKSRSSETLLPKREALEPICWLLEEFADEWITRWFVYSRWYNREDAEALERAIGDEMTRGIPVASRSFGKLAASGIKRMVGAGGARASNQDALEQSRTRTLEALESIVARREGDLLTDHPTVADFALYGQLEQYRRDPTGGRRMERYEALDAWLDRLDRMRLPHPVVADRRGEPLELSVLNPLFAEFFGTYWRMLLENARAFERGEDEAEATLVDGTTFEWSTSGYLKDRLAFVLDRLDHLAEHRDRLLGPDRLRLGDMLDEQVERLGREEFGRELLESRTELTRAFGAT